MQTLVVNVENDVAKILKENVKMVAPFLRLAIEESMINKGLMTEEELKKIKENAILGG